MQDTQSGLDNCRRLGVDEQYIKFRPSPNFKNMKKFLKSKIDNSESSSQSPPNGTEPTTPNSESPPRNNFHMEHKSPVNQTIQPPLPLEPPPPDSPPIIPVPLKEEIIDDEYLDNGHKSPEDTDHKETLELNFETKIEEPHTISPQKPQQTICRDFIRGTCSRNPCKFAHRRDLSQLHGVYTFCKNYQNNVCTLKQCKYVHATVFEEQEFYRTAVLPPRALSHLKKPFYLMPPPPPPPPEDPPEVAQIASATSPRQVSSVFAMTCPSYAYIVEHITFYDGLVEKRKTSDKPLISCVPVSKLESKPADIGIRNMLQAMTSPLKREWSSNLFSTPPRDLVTKEHFAKKCKNCDTMDIRLQINKEKVEGMTRSSEDLKTKEALLNKKTNALFTVLLTVVKSQAASVGGMNGLMASLNMCGEKEKALLQHILESHRPHFNNMIT